MSGRFLSEGGGFSSFRESRPRESSRPRPAKRFFGGGSGLPGVSGLDIKVTSLGIKNPLTSHIPYWDQTSNYLDRQISKLPCTISSSYCIPTQKHSVVVNMVQMAMSHAIMTALNTTTVDALASQMMLVECNTPLNPSTGKEIPPSSCRVCQEALGTMKRARADFSGNPADNGKGFENVCDFVCGSCVTKDITQVTVASIQFSLDSTTNLRAEILNKTSQVIQQSVKVSLDALGAIGGVLAKEQGCITQEIMSRIEQSVNQQVFVDMLRRMVAMQNVSVSGNSIFVAKVKQSIDMRAVMVAVSDTNAITNLYSDDEMNAAERYIFENDALSQLFGDIAEGVRSTGVTAAFGDLMIISALAIAVFALILFAWRGRTIYKS